MAPLSNHFSAKSLDDIRTGLYIAMAEVFLYGAYAVMFGFYIHILHTRRIAKNRFLAVATISLFIFCTVHLALLLASTAFFNESDKASVVKSKPHSHGSFTAFNLNRVTNVIYVTSNVIADSIFIFRCYAIWNFQRKVIIFPMLSTLSAAVLGYFDSGLTIRILSLLFDLSIGMSLFTTFVLMGLSVGRIWWAARKAREIVGPKMISRYYTVCAMILESGAVYCAGGIVFLILSVHHNTSEVVATNGAILGQLVGIAPTIIAVRVGLGKSIESVDSFVAMAQPRVRGPRDIEPAFARSIEHHILDLRPENDHDSTKAEAG
ncbi:hypothetical protein K438DRAFT_1874546 [Mycena galopus ATCC 62051]|nr:hypothetical protein K438DRAFT_1874546 [Mycena galopus ATCC 62051]